VHILFIKLKLRTEGHTENLTAKLQNSNQNSTFWLDYSEVSSCAMMLKPVHLLEEPMQDQQ